jgi:precorrin-6A synthase
VPARLRASTERVRKLFVVGIGAGNLDHLTLQAVQALRQLSVVFVMNKGEDKEALLGLRRTICERHMLERPYRIVELSDPPREASILDYQARVAAWHERRVGALEAAIARELAEDDSGGLLVWGDPSLYDSTLRLIDQLRMRARVAFEYTVIPGITSVAALAASHRTVLHDVGGSVLITTGRKLRERGLPQEAGAVVVMLDGECSFQGLPNPERLEIFWGAYLGTPDEILRAGRLSELSAEIVRVRAEARQRHGWIMDTYLLRKSTGTEARDD